jgi:hypothetical protein
MGFPRASSTPWKILPNGYMIVAADGGFVASLLDRADIPESKLDAEFIVRAVNVHDALVSALEAVTEQLDRIGCDKDLHYVEVGRAALELAKGE